MSSLFSALNVGDRSIRALNVALQVTGQNIANAATEGYHRQRVDLRPSDPTNYVTYHIGTGVEVRRIERVIDLALEQLVHDSHSSLGELDTLKTSYLRLESVFNEFSDSDISSAFDNFFNSIEDLAQRPEDMTARAAVVSSGKMLSDAFRSLVTRINQARAGNNSAVETAVEDVNRYLKQLAELNRDVVFQEDAGTATSEANDIRDRRDSVIEKLSQLMDVEVHEQSSGAVIVYSGSDTLVYGDNADQLNVEYKYEHGVELAQVYIASSGKLLGARGGKLGGMLQGRDTVLKGYLDDILQLSQTFIGEFNKVHAGGRGLAGYDSIQAANAVDDANATLDPATFDSPLTNGSFKFYVSDSATGLETAHEIMVDLDGVKKIEGTVDSVTTVGSVDRITSNALLGYGDDVLNGATVEITDSSSGTIYTVKITDYVSTTGSIDIDNTTVPLGVTLDAGDTFTIRGKGTEASLETVRAQLDAVDGIDARINNGKLEIGVIGTNKTFSFGKDTSGVLAALGINTFFTGKDALDMDVNEAVADDPSLFAAAQSDSPGDNTNALAMTDLRNTPTVGGISTFEDAYEEIVGRLGAESASMQDQFANQQVMTDQVLNEREAISGVSLDEETINLVTYQRAFQASARYIAIVNDLLNTLISIA